MVWKRCVEAMDLIEKDEQLKKALKYARWLWYEDIISDATANNIDLKISKLAKSRASKKDKDERNAKKNKDAIHEHEAQKKKDTQSKPEEKEND